MVCATERHDQFEQRLADARRDADACDQRHARLTPIDVITSNSFSVTLNTTAMTLSDGFRDHPADEIVPTSASTADLI